MSFVFLPRFFRGLLPLLLLMVVVSSCAPSQSAQESDPDEREWIQLFNGENLDGWQIKFTGHPLGENLNNTFRVEDGLLKVRYDEWDGFDGQFGHIFHTGVFSHYLLGAEYRFVGEQVANVGEGMDWARRNNGLMLHSQSATSMGLDQDFPICIEVQLLGGLGTGERSTANLCTPGSHVVMDGELVTDHCVRSASDTYHGDQWVRVEVLVQGADVVKHIVEGDTVMTYTKPQVGGGMVADFDPAVYDEGDLLTQGHIALQAETGPTDFRKIELLPLAGCTDPDALNYKSYYTESVPEECEY